MQTWQRRSTRIAYENQWIRVREDEVTRPDGSDGIYGVVQVRNPAVFVVALTDADEVVLVEVDRYTTGDRSSLEVPAGGTDGEDPLVAARRELREETGLAASEWRELGRMNALIGVADAPQVVYLARGLTHVGDDAMLEDGIVAVHRMPLGELLARVARGEIADDATLAALLLALVALGRVG
ncbi:NUDIX hydrolase [Nocardioides sp. LHD-245]|uniref:NUDIX hydrolase n=1 Tax=Nocardioides sp. LHD-245 TaxID=3051387 RepID=UPI0027E1A2A4|nr:NUDIX hydrolase [Nocardioides sp. LHD-245]